MELERPRPMPILPEWDLGIVLEILAKPLYELLWETSLKYLTYKMVFRLAMASVGKCSKLQVFDPKYLQLKPQVSGITLYFSDEFLHKNQGRPKLMTPGTHQRFKQ